MFRLVEVGFNYGILFEFDKVIQFVQNSVLVSTGASAIQQGQTELSNTDSTTQLPQHDTDSALPFRHAKLVHLV
jgi:hypothetical protein